jgi:ATPase subunit of ABC transporter with duplicated ATPase domains
MGHLDVSRVSYALPDGTPLLDDVSFRVPASGVVALVGANGAGKSTLLRLIAGEIPMQTGTITSSGTIGVIPQFIGSVRDKSVVRDLLLATAPQRVREAAAAVDAAELALMETEDERLQMHYAQALADWADAGGYDIEVLWDTVTVAALHESTS